MRSHFKAQMLKNQRQKILIQTKRKGYIIFKTLAINLTLEFSTKEAEL